MDEINILPLSLSGPLYFTVCWCHTVKYPTIVSSHLLPLLHLPFYPPLLLQHKTNNQPPSLPHIWLGGCCVALGPPAAGVDVHGRLGEQAEEQEGPHGVEACTGCTDAHWSQQVKESHPKLLYLFALNATIFFFFQLHFMSWTMK